MELASRRESFFAATQRRDAAWLLLLLWGVTFLAAPLMHMIGHRADHVHMAGGGVVLLEQASHHHGDGAVHGHGHQGAPADAERAPAPVHGADSPEHLSAALLSVWSLTTVPICTALRLRLSPPRFSQPVAAEFWRGLGARGPPSPAG